MAKVRENIDPMADIYHNFLDGDSTKLENTNTNKVEGVDVSMPEIAPTRIEYGFLEAVSSNGRNGNRNGNGKLEEEIPTIDYDFSPQTERHLDNLAQYSERVQEFFKSDTFSDMKSHYNEMANVVLDWRNFQKGNTDKALDERLDVLKKKRKQLKDMKNDLEDHVSAGLFTKVKRSIFGSKKEKTYVGQTQWKIDKISREINNEVEDLRSTIEDQRNYLTKFNEDEQNLELMETASSKTNELKQRYVDGRNLDGLVNDYELKRRYFSNPKNFSGNLDLSEERIREMIVWNNGSNSELTDRELQRVTQGEQFMPSVFDNREYFAQEYDSAVEDLGLGNVDQIVGASNNYKALAREKNALMKATTEIEKIKKYDRHLKDKLAKLNFDI